MNPEAAPPTKQAGRTFVTTHWSVVWNARNGDTRAAEIALENLCRTYRSALYAYVRREGFHAADAEDLTQEFLARFVHKEWLNHLQDQRGRFRSFLLTFLKNFLRDERDRAGAKKRGSGKAPVSLDAYEAEERELLGPVDGLTADQIYERRWALALMARAIERLREDYAARDQSALFEQLKDVQPGEHGERSYAQIGSASGMSEQAVKNAALTFRRRYARFLRDEIAQTVLESGQVEEELRHLMQAFTR